MIEIKYVSSSGKEYNLIGDKMRITEGNFHRYKWTPQKKELECGAEVYGFTKESITYETTLTVRGSLEERKNFLNGLQDDFEQDVLCVKPGKIHFGNYYISAYIISSDTGKSDIINCWSKNEIEIYCPYPFWISEKHHVFKSEDITSTNNKRYPNRFAFRYANGLTNTSIVNSHFADCGFRLIIYGPVVKPQIIIGGYSYYVDLILEEGEYLEVDSAANSITKVMNTGTRVNCFHNRDKKNNIFRKIPPGNLNIDWSGKFDFDLILYEERSEPKW